MVLVVSVGPLLDMTWVRKRINKLSMHKKALFIIILIFLLPSIAWPCTITAYFSPYDNIEQVIIDELNNAEKSVQLSLFGGNGVRLAY